MYCSSTAHMTRLTKGHNSVPLSYYLYIKDSEEVFAAVQTYVFVIM